MLDCHYLAVVGNSSYLEAVGNGIGFCCKGVISRYGSALVKAWELSVEADGPEGCIASGQGYYLSGDTAVLEAVPADGCVFLGWYDGGILAEPAASAEFSIDRDISLRAVFAHMFSVTWEDHDGSVLGIPAVREGDLPVYPGADPEREAAAGFVYSFAGWSPEISPANGDAVYRAVYDAVPDRDHVVDGGQCGDRLSWELRGDGSLRISGSGDMWSWPDKGDVPWHIYRSDITSISLGGAESIGD